MILQRVESISIGDMIISDHAPVILQIADVFPRGKDILWRFPTYLASDEEFKSLLKGWWLEYTSTNAIHNNSPSLYWETAKVVLRGRIMAYTKK